MWKDIAIPKRMQKLPKDRRGFPVPFIVLQDEKGEYHFKMNDERKVDLCIQQNLCSICGQSLPHDDVWFVGGQQSAFHPQGAFNDSPMHKECVVYALQVCPYMAYSQYQRKQEATMEKQAEINSYENSNYIFVDPTQSEERLAFFCLCRSTEYSIHRYFPFRYFHPNKPYYDVEYWADGKQITLDEAKAMLHEKQQRSWLPRFEIQSK